ncbi:protein DELETION OF SUV3 SUPPRESSOR 1(I)-like [Salvia hispanica]|uniref:protein DELETION OF SUV3 SUPPRESSOR 1(I)-like n=1 Tax=Salvia hispanica TaxID=49212 RepID=UPI0020093AD4|nr:protein DELETION OF SUV3 SUPPRESSOR 1(I)-like [Salvia hispanica]
MATEQAKPATDEVKMDLFEDGDEFEEFEIGQGCTKRILYYNHENATESGGDKEEGKEVDQQWEDDWDDDDVTDDFSLQLRRELDSNAEKKEGKT